MAVPLATCTVTVTRNTTEQDSDPYDSTPSLETVATNVRAVISPPTGTARLVGGTRVVYNAQLRCDPTDLQTQDQVTDSSGILWIVEAASNISANGLAFSSATLRRVTGAL